MSRDIHASTKALHADERPQDWPSPSVLTPHAPALCRLVANYGPRAAAAALCKRASLTAIISFICTGEI